jgi:hypothetical protein
MRGSLGSLGDIDEESIIKYIIAGIDDIDSNKIILFGSTGMADFKKKLVIYEEYKNSSTTRIVNKLFAKQATDRKEDDTNFEEFRKNFYKYLKLMLIILRCYSCADPGHISRECRNRSVGAKCYNWSYPADYLLGYDRL